MPVCLDSLLRETATWIFPTIVADTYNLNPVRCPNLADLDREWVEILEPSGERDTFPDPSLLVPCSIG